MGKSFWCSIFVLLLSNGCASPLKLSLPQPISLRLKGVEGRSDVTAYYSHARINAFAQDQKVKERDEIVEFKVSEKMTAVDESQQRMTVVASTISKDGTVDLHDLAFPELNEEIEYIFDRSAKVYQAGIYPPESVFFVPPLPLPKDPVSIGETWTMDHLWVGLKNGVPLRVELIGILKDIVACGPNGHCADIEVSGNVDVVGAKRENVEFQSQVWGRVLFALERGTVVWSEIRNKEMMRTPEERMEILACMTAALEEPQSWRRGRAKPFCRPSSEPVTQIP